MREVTCVCVRVQGERKYSRSEDSEEKIQSREREKAKPSERGGLFKANQ